MRRVPTIKEVAVRANVSIGSASRVFNNNPTVTEETARVVRRAAEELGYHHRNAKQKVVSGPPQRIAMLTLGMDRSLTTLPVIASLLQSIQRIGRESQQEIVYCDVPDLNAVPKCILDRTVDAVLVKAALQGSAEMWQQAPVVRALEMMPHVWLLGRPLGCGGDMIGSDDDAVGRLAAEHLLEHGHRNVVMLNPKPDHQSFIQRQASFCGHGMRLGMNVKFMVPPLARISGPVRPVNDPAEVDALIEPILKLTPKPTAIFVPADSVAVLCYRTLAQRGLQAGRDISLISCNNEHLLTAGLYPALTTIDIHVAEIGASGMEYLAFRSGRPANAHSVTLAIAPTLVTGESVHNLGC